MIEDLRATIRLTLLLVSYVIIFNQKYSLLVFPQQNRVLHFLYLLNNLTIFAQLPKTIEGLLTVRGLLHFVNC